jgi:hypothetical protein
MRNHRIQARPDPDRVTVKDVLRVWAWTALCILAMRPAAALIVAVDRWLQSL